MPHKGNGEQALNPESVDGIMLHDKQPLFLILHHGYKCARPVRLTWPKRVNSNQHMRKSTS